MSETSDRSDRRLLGIIYPFVILGYVAAIYYGIIVRLYWMKESRPSLSSPLV